MAVNAYHIIKQYLHGLISHVEATRALETLEIRGAFDKEGYTGYDYRQQRWVVVKV